MCNLLLFFQCQPWRKNNKKGKHFPHISVSPVTIWSRKSLTTDSRKALGTALSQHIIVFLKPTPRTWRVYGVRPTEGWVLVLRVLPKESCATTGFTKKEPIQRGLVNLVHLFFGFSLLKTCRGFKRRYEVRGNSSTSLTRLLPVRYNTQYSIYPCLVNVLTAWFVYWHLDRRTFPKKIHFFLVSIRCKYQLNLIYTELSWIVVLPLFLLFLLFSHRWRKEEEKYLGHVFQIKWKWWNKNETWHSDNRLISAGGSDQDEIQEHNHRAYFPFKAIKNIAWPALPKPRTRFTLLHLAPRGPSPYGSEDMDFLYEKSEIKWDFSGVSDPRRSNKECVERETLSLSFYARLILKSNGGIRQNKEISHLSLNT